MENWVKEYWVKALFGGVISAFGVSVAWAKKKFKRQVALELGMQALLRNEIIREYDKWIERGYCPIYARDNIQNMYTQYHGLGQNGVIDGLYETILDLPTEKPNKEKEC
jgi:hypothetical protein